MDSEAEANSLVGGTKGMTEALMMLRLGDKL